MSASVRLGVASTALAVLLPTAFPAPRLPDERKPCPAPVGRWAVQRLEMDGQVIYSKPRPDQVLRFTTHSFELESHGLKTPTSAGAEFYELNGVRGMEYRPEGPDAPARAIWKVDGDTLTLCESLPGGPRPTDFTAPKGSHRVLWVLKRVGD